MSGKKLLFTLTASTVIATSLLGTSAAAADTYTVQSGDTVWSVSQKYNTSTENIKDWNNLNSNTLYVGDELIVTEQGNESSSEDKFYTVQDGDTLTVIAEKFDTTVASIKNQNNLNSNALSVGQELQVNEPKEVVKSASFGTGYDVNQLIDTATSLVGTNYTWGGNSPSTGFDCSGFIYYVFNQAGMDTNRLTAAGYYNMASIASNPQPGDLVFFANTYGSGISHMGIYIGNNNFVHASSSGVQITSLGNPYWNSHFHSFGSF